MTYVLTASPSIYWRDSPEFALSANFLDIAHSPGSPAYNLLAKLFTWLPIGSIAFRLSLLSIVAASFNAGLTYAIVRLSLRQLFPLAAESAGSGLIHLAAIVGALSVTFSFSLWEWANTQEVYALQAFFFNLITLLFLIWSGHIIARREQPQDESGLARDTMPYAIFLLWGVSLGVHATMILGMPAYLFWYCQQHNWRLKLKSLAILGTMAGLGFSVYLYLPIRTLVDLPLDIGNPETLGKCLKHMFVTGDKAASLGLYLPTLGRQFERYGRWLMAEFSLPMLLLGLIGLIALLKKQRGLLAYLMLLAATNVAFFIRTWDRPFGFIPSFLVIALIMGMGAYILLAATVHSAPKRNLKKIGAMLLLGLALIGLGSSALTHYRQNDKSDYWIPAQHGRILLDSLPEGAILFSANDNVAFIVRYLQYIEGVRPDIMELHRSILKDPVVQAKRFPGLVPLSLAGQSKRQAMATFIGQNLAYPIYWDIGKDLDAYLDYRQLEPYGIIFRVLPSPDMGDRTVIRHGNEEIWASYHRRVISQLAPADWTGVENYVRIFHFLGSYYESLQNHAAAERSFLAAAALNPSDPLTQYNLGSVAMNRGQRGPGQIFFRRAIELDPYLTQARIALTISYLQERNWPKAEEELVPAYHLAPHDPFIKENLGKLYFMKHDCAQAMAVWQPLPAEGYNDPNVSRMMQKCDQNVMNWRPTKP